MTWHEWDTVPRVPPGFLCFNWDPVCKIWAPSPQPAACGGSLRAILPLHSSKKFANYLQHMKHFPSSKYSNLLRELHGKCSPASLVATFLYVENVFSMWMVTSGYNWVEAATERVRQGRWHILAGLQPSSQTAFYNNGQDLRILSYGWIKVDCLFATVASLFGWVLHINQKIVWRFLWLSLVGVFC